MSQNAQQEAMFIQHQMSEPRTPIGIFELPCGYISPSGELVTEVKVREITGVEEDLLASSNISAGRKVTQLIGNCLESVGSITDKPELIKIARDLVMGDRVFLMISIRRVTLGDLFPFEDECTLCNTKNLFSVNLSELKSKRMTDPMKRVFDVALPSGKAARYHVMCGRDEETSSKAVQGADRMSIGIFVRLDRLDNAPPDMNAVKNLGMRDRNFLREQFEEIEGGIETNIELTCPACGEDFETELNVGQSGFFFPTRIQKNSKRNSSS